MKFRVQIIRTVSEYAIFLVEAETESSARRKALRKAKHGNEEEDKFCDSDEPKYRTRVL